MISLRTEPRGDAYRDLVRYLGRLCSSFELVHRRKGCAPNKHAQSMIGDLRPYETSLSNVTEWSGTQLGRGAGAARLARYRLTPESLSVLLAVDGLYSWCLPNLPEDLAFFTGDESCFFSTTSHEREAMLRSGSVTSEQFASANPDIAFDWYPGSR